MSDLRSHHETPDRPIRVLHVVPYFPPERLGGVGQYVADLHDELRDRGHASEVLTAGRESRPGVHRIAAGSLAWILRSGLWSGRAASFDIVHFQAGEALPLMIMLRLRRRRPRLLTTFHLSYKGMSESFQPYSIGGRRFSRGWPSLKYRWITCTIRRGMDRVAVWLSDGVNTISRAAARDMFGPARAKGTTIIYYGMPVRDESREPDPGLAVADLLYVGGPGHRKRVYALPYVLSRVRRHLPDATLRLVGFRLEDHPDLLQLFASQDLLDAVESVGFKRPDELGPYYRSARVLVVPSAYEGLPLVILEAMQRGLPPVVTRVSGHPEAIVDGDNGYLVDLDRPEQMADRCVELLTDLDLWSRISQAACSTISERFSMARQRTEYMRVYETLRDTGSLDTHAADAASAP